MYRIAQNIWVLFYSTLTISSPPGGCGGQFIPCVCASPVCQFVDFFPDNLADFSFWFSAYLDFFSDIKVFNIGQSPWTTVGWNWNVLYYNTVLVHTLLSPKWGNRSQERRDVAPSRPCNIAPSTMATYTPNPLEEGWRQKQRQRSSRLFWGKKLFNSYTNWNKRMNSTFCS